LPETSKKNNIDCLLKAANKSMQGIVLFCIDFNAKNSFFVVFVGTAIATSTV
jgi:hypothetical protein